MAYRLVLTTEKAANAKPVESSSALSVARAEWESGKWQSVRLLTEDGALYWKRGACGSAEAEARDMAALASAAGLARLTPASDEVGGLADLERHLSPHASSFEIRSKAPEIDGLLECDGEPPRVRDLLAYVDARLTAPATLTGWSSSTGPGVNPAHGCLDVEIRFEETVA